ncbi:MAG: acetyltransferase [Lachnospiraceae bacterium]|nr:acetyltransferase [Lachnospiraceae bacterium]
MEKIILLGNGGHAGSVTDSIKQLGQYEIAGFVGRAAAETNGAGFPIIGTDDDLKAIYDSGIRTAFVAIGYLGEGNARERAYGKLKQIGYRLPHIIDPSATLADGAQIGEGTYVAKGAIINVNSHVGKMSIINTGAIVEHDNVVGNFSHIAVGSVLCGNVTVGDNTLVGANATVIQGVEVGSNVIVGAGTTVRYRIESGQIYYGK